jgi:hypothetical protein
MKVRLLAIGIIILFLTPLFYSPPSLNSFERAEFRFKPGRLIVMEEPPEQNYEDENQAFAQAKKANIIVYSIAAGYVDKNDQRHFPWSQASLSKSKQLIIMVDFKVTKRAKVGVHVVISGPTTSETPEEPLIINAKKNAYYQQEFILDLTQGNSQDDSNGGPVPGLYDMIGIVYPYWTEFPMKKSGGMTFASMRTELKE